MLLLSSKKGMRMKPSRFVMAVVVIALTVGLIPAQNYAPPPSKPPDEATLRIIGEKTLKLHELVTSLRRQNVRDPYLADVEIYHKAAAWIVRHSEFYQPDAGAWTLDALDRGLLRARQLAQGEAP